MTVEIRLLGSGNAALLATAVDGVFDHAVDPGLAEEFLADRRHLIAVAVADGRVVGFASGVTFVHPDKPVELWVNEVGVAPPHQRQGLGAAVMKRLFAAGRAAGCRQAWVLTDRGNRAARGLYAALGGADMAGRMVGVEFRLD